MDMFLFFIRRKILGKQFRAADLPHYFTRSGLTSSDYPLINVQCGGCLCLCVGGVVVDGNTDEPSKQASKQVCLPPLKPRIRYFPPFP